MANVTVDLRMASMYRFCPSVFGPRCRPRVVRRTSPNTSDGRPSSSLIMSMVLPTDSLVSVCPWPRMVRSSSNSRATFSASISSPVIVISLPRTWMCEENASSTNLRSSSRCPRRATMDWLPGTRIFTCVEASANSVFPAIHRKGPRRDRRGHQDFDYTGAWGRSPRRPAHRTAPQQVEVDVEHALAGVRPDVRHQPPPRAVDAFGLRQVRRRLHDLGQQLPVLVRDGRRRLDVILRDQKDVGGRLRPDVAERHHLVGLVHDIGLDLAPGDLAEQAVGRGLGHDAAESTPACRNGAGPGSPPPRPRSPSEGSARPTT